jgi:hypothetical protein
LSHITDFLGGTLGLLHPILFIATLWAAVRFWKITPRQQLARFFFAMGAPLFLFYFLYTFHSSVQLNWIAPAIIPLFCLAALFWEERAQTGAPKNIRCLLAVAMALGLFAATVMHHSDPFLQATNGILAQFGAKPLPDKADPLRRVRGAKSMARITARERDKLALEGKPVFIIGGHYGTVGLLSFYMPNARRAVTSTPLVFYRALARPKNQFYFWPTYRDLRPGDNALYVQEKERPAPAPPDILRSFASVTEVGTFPIKERGRVLRHMQVFACRDPR